MRIIDQIHERSAFTPSERDLAAYLEEHSKEAINLSLDEVSSEIFVSKSTIIRFCKKLGFKGYKELCVQLAKELSTYILDDRTIDSSFPFSVKDDKKALADKVYALSYGAIVQTYQDLDLNQIERLAKAIHEASEVYIYATNDCLLMAKALSDGLQVFGYNVHYSLMGDTSYQVASLQSKNSIALFINYRSRAHSSQTALKILDEKHIPIYAIQGPFKSLINNYAQDVITTNTYEGNPKVVNISSRNSMTFILDVLYAYVYAIDLEKNEKTVKDRYALTRSIVEGIR